MARTLLEAVLRRAILQGGSIGYNPDMYDYPTCMTTGSLIISHHPRNSTTS